MYKNTLILFLASLLGICSGPAYAATGNEPAGPAYLIHLDKSFYVNGEMIWYKLLLPADRRHEGVAIKVVLSDRHGNNLFYTYLKNPTANYVAGYYKIPFDMPGGVYRLNFLAANAASGQSYVLAYADLPIYNDSETIDPARVREGNAGNRGNTPGRDLRVSIDLTADTIRSRNQMQANIRVTDGSGQPVEAQVSIAVSDQELLALGGSQSTVISGRATAVAEEMSSSISLPVGLTDYNNQALAANVLGVLAPDQKRIHYTRTMSAGKVNLQLPDFYADQPFQFIGLPQEEDSIKVTLPSDTGLAAQGELIYTPEVIEYLELSRQRKKIFQLYTDLEFNLQPEIPALTPQELKPERVVKVKDYEPFDNMYLFFKEILTPLVFRQVKGEVFEAKVFTDRGNRVYEMLPGAPLFIIDGQATRDGNYVAHMKMDMVETVEIFTDRSELRRQFNVMGSGGVVIINTNSSDITVPDSDADDIRRIQGLQVPAGFPAYTPEQFGADRHRPFFRPQLYWNPDLKTNATGQVSTSFYQSDATGNFQLRVLVQDKQGRTGYAEKTYYAAW